MRTMMAVRWALIGVLALLLSGCLVTQDPVIAPGSGEDLGQRIEYRSHATGKASDVPMIVRLTRKPGKRYLLQAYVQEDGTETMVGVQPLTDLRRIATRKGNPVYLVQMDLQDSAQGGAAGKFMTYLVAIDANHVGVLAVFDCKDERIVRLAAKHDIELACASDLDSRYVSSISNRPGSTRMWDFLTESLRSGLVGWEDTLGVSVVGSVPID